MGALLTRRVQVAAKTEDAAGTAEDLTATEATILAYEPIFNFNPAQFKRDPYRKTLSRMHSEPGQQPCELTFRAEMMGPPFANIGTTCALATFLMGCSFDENFNGGEQSAYTPLSTGMKTLTIAVYEDGLEKKLCGAMGNVRIICAIGEPIMAEFTFTGKYSAHSSTGMLSPDYPDSKPVIFQNAEIKVFGDILLLSSLEINMQNEVSLRPDPGDSTGIAYAQIVARNPILTFDPEQELVATHDFLSKLKSTTEAAITIEITSADNMLTVLSMPKARYTGLAEADRDGVRTYSATCELNMSSGDDELSITFRGTTTTTSTSSSTTSTSTTSTSTSTTTTSTTSTSTTSTTTTI